MKLFSINLKKTVCCDFLVLNKSNLIPKLLIDVPCQSLDKTRVLLVKHFPAALLYNLHLISVCLVAVKGTDTLDNMISMRTLDNPTNFICPKIEGRLLKSRIQTALDKGIRRITILAVLGNQTCKFVTALRPGTAPAAGYGRPRDGSGRSG